MKDRSIPVLIVVVSLVIAALAPAVAAQSIPRTVFLDEDTRRIGTIAVDGQTYQVYHHDNLVPWASGVEIYTEGHRVTSESTAQMVLEALAQRRAVSDLGKRDADLLQASAANVTETATNVSESTAAINGTLAYLMDTKDLSAEGSTVFNESLEAAPTIDEFNQTAREVGPKLRSFDNDSEAYTSNATRLATLIERRENGDSVDPQRLYDRYSTTLEEMQRLSEHTDFSGVTEPLRTVAAQSESISENVSTVPKRGDELVQRFERTHNTSSVARNGTQVLELPGFALEEPQDTAQSLQSTWVDEWEERRNAAMTVYKTIIGGAVAILIVGGYVWWRRR